MWSLPLVSLVIFTIIPFSLSCPDPEVFAPCTCSSSFRRRFASTIQTHLQITCSDVPYLKVKSSLANWAASNITTSVHSFAATGLFADDRLKKEPSLNPNHLEGDFFGGNQFRSVVLAGNGIHSFSQQTFNAVIDHLDLSGNSLRSLPFNLNLMIRKVNLSSNLLTEIGHNTFNSETVDLSYNRLSLIRRGAFKVVSTLNLNLDYNNLGSNSLQPNFIHPFSLNLSSVDLDLFIRFNNLTHLSYDVFSFLEQPSNVYINLEGNPLQCDCRIKWLLDLKRMHNKYDDSSSSPSLYPDIVEAKCPEGSDLMKQFYSPRLHSCKQEMDRSDDELLSPCQLKKKGGIRCYRSLWESVRDAVDPLNEVFMYPLPLKVLVLDRILFPADTPRLESGVFDFVKIQELKIQNTNLRQIDDKAFSYSTFSLEEVSLKGNQFVHGEDVFPFLSRFINLESVDLNSNQLTNVPANVFSGMSNLKYINLANNAVKQVESHAFHLPLTSVLYRNLVIDLQSNLLGEESFEKGWISVPDLKVSLKLQRNRISDIKDVNDNFLLDLVLNHTKYNHEVFLNDNPIQCNPVVKELVSKYVIHYDGCSDYAKSLVLAAERLLRS